MKKFMNEQSIDKVTGEWEQEPSEDPGSDVSSDRENISAGPVLEPSQSNSNEKKRTLEVRGDSDPRGSYSEPKKRRPDQSLDVEDARTPVMNSLNKPGTSKVSVTDGNDVQQKEQTGSSGKRRRRRWDVEGKNNGEEGEDEKTAKRRKTRWDEDPSQLKMLGPLQLPSFAMKIDASDLDPEIQRLKVKLREINSKIIKAGIADDVGVRNKSRGSKYYERLVKDRQRVIAKLIKKNPTFMVPPEYKSSKFCKKLYIPIEEYPNYNFIGLIIGPRGNNQKRMERETGAKIMLRGKGSAKEKKGLQKHDLSEDDDLHVLVEADTQKSLDGAVKMVEELLVPVSEEKNELKRKQLRELAKLNGTLKDENLCRTCGEDGHKTYACPSLNSTFLDSNNSYGLFDGGSNRTTTSCTPLISPPSTQPDLQFYSFPADRCGIKFTSGPSSVPRYMLYGLGSSPSYGSHSHSGTGFIPTKGSNANGRIDSAEMFPSNYLPHRVPQYWSSNGDRRNPCAYPTIPHHDSPSKAWPGPPGSLLPGAYQVIPHSDSPSKAWPGPPGSFLSDAQSPSSTEKDDLGLPPISVFLGHSDSSPEEIPPPSSRSPCYVPVPSLPSVAMFTRGHYSHPPYQPYFTNPRDKFCYSHMYPPHVLSRNLVPMPNRMPCYSPVRIPQ